MPRPEPVRPTMVADRRNRTRSTREHRRDRQAGGRVAQHGLVRAHRQAPGVGGDQAPHPGGHRRAGLPAQRLGQGAEGGPHPHDRPGHPAGQPAPDRHAARLRGQRGRRRRPRRPGRPAVALRRRARPLLRTRRHRPARGRRHPHGDPAGGRPGCPAAAARPAVRRHRPHPAPGGHVLGGRRLRDADRQVRPPPGRPRPPAAGAGQPQRRAGRGRLRPRPPGAVRLRPRHRRARPARRAGLLRRRRPGRAELLEQLLTEHRG